MQDDLNLKHARYPLLVIPWLLEEGRRLQDGERLGHEEGLVNASDVGVGLDRVAVEALLRGVHLLAEEAGNRARQVVAVEHGAVS